MSGIVGVIVVLALAGLLGWGSYRLWHVRSTPLRIVGGLTSTLLTLIVASAAVIGLLGLTRLYLPDSGPAPTLTAMASPAGLQLAARRVNGCTGCHSTAMAQPLDGGATNMLADGPALGVLYAPNLTPGGPLREWTDGEILRAMREGVGKDGRPLVIMPSEAFHALSDEDALTLVAYLRTQPAVDRQTPPRDLSIVSVLLIGAGVLPTAEQPPVTERQVTPPVGSIAHGRYLVEISGCAACHGATLEGGAPGGFGPPAGPGLRPIVGRWTEAEFIVFFRTGVDPTGRAVDTTRMPWKDIGMAYDDDELRSLFTYLRGSGST